MTVAEPVGETVLVREPVRARARFWLAAAALALLVSCHAPRGSGSAPRPIEAEQHLGAALDHLRDRERVRESEPARAEFALRSARAELEAALAAAPDWPAPARLLDDLAREELAHGERYRDYLRRLAEAPGDAATLYLIGRLEVDGRERFRRAALLSPRSPWAHHALGVEHQREGRLGAALAHAERSLARARGGYEVAWFARRLAELERAAGRGAAARRVLGEVANREDLPAAERLLLRFALARLELAEEDAPEVVELGFQRALDLLAGGELTARERADLLLAAQAGRAGRSEEAWQFELWRALEAGGWSAELEQRPGDLLGARTRFLSQLVGLGRGEVTISGPALRVAGFQTGPFGEAVERWLAALPSQVVDAEGLPRDTRLAAVVAAARELGPESEPEELAAFVELLLTAGWFEEARAVASAFAVAGGDGERAFAFETRARAGLALVGELGAILESAQGNQRSFQHHPLQPPSGRRPRDLVSVLTAVARVVERYGPAAGLEDVDLPQRIRNSPRLAYGPFARVVVPGPVFALRDEAMGFGPAGSPVPGLAEVLDRLGRAALLGQVTGQPADGTVLRLLYAEERSGTRMGVPFNGLVLWCEGAETSGGLGRAGGMVSGAALHEGYWIDLEAERRRHRRWRELEARWIDGGDPEALARVLGESGFPVAGAPEKLRRRTLDPPLGAADRLRLTILAERDAPAEPGGSRIALAELLELVAVHEEGHLIDRTRFLPLGRRPGAVLRFGFSHAFSPAAIERALEYRAQRVALCELPDPRLALVDLLDSVEVPEHLAGVHARAYRELLRDLLGELERAIGEDEEAFPAIDRDRTLLHQLHRLTPEEVRTLALSLPR